MKPELTFSMQIPGYVTRELCEGKLRLQTDPSYAGIKFRATSGCQGYQFESATRLKGKGMMPSSDQIAPLKWQLMTDPIPLPNVKGVEGNFYRILPYSINIKGVERGDFGIHYDANVPGSAGCIVLRSRDHWRRFQQEMRILYSKGHAIISLHVDYPLLANN